MSINKNIGLLQHQFDLELTQKDWVMFQKAVSNQNIGRPTVRLMIFWLNLILWFGIIVVLTLFKKEISSLHTPTIYVLCLLFVGILSDIAFIWRIQRNGYIPKKNGFWVGRHTFLFYENALVIESNNSKCMYSWKLIKNTKDDRGNLFIFIDSYFGYVFPKIKMENIKELEKNLCRLCKR